ncbi:hypothetical protein [Spiribacter vilamensis]|uniref:Outer membrane protein beta-barrel domain-containing protein n=1 Tax=Spiribacter vilamensis TaxID=531306 RepID=A0A4Q8CZV8_9GAMM|nr:hypothetical protein [Spiribacter vilamensis]RZU98487.1 hypothetical protein EV698_0735 [Spiribacter vilamensis]TVO60643.1 hypothetical protein FPL09_00255 [Spiribacter vilamensis]
MTRQLLLISAATIAMSASVHAQPVDWQSNGALEPELTARLNDRLDIRFGVSDRPVRRNDLSHSAFDLMGDELAFSALIDWSFSDNGLRMRGGARYGDIPENAESWSPSAIKRDNIQTYVGVGWDNNISRDGRLGLSLDMGLSFESIPDADGAETGSGAALTDDSGLGSTFESFRYKPSVSAGLEYRF